MTVFPRLAAPALLVTSLLAGSAAAARPTVAPHLVFVSTPQLRLPANVRPACPREVRPGFARCGALVRSDIAGRPVPDAGLYGPADFQAAYKLPSGGSGQIVAIVDAYDDPNAEADLGVYRSHYGLPACTTANGCFRKLNQKGNKGPYPRGDAGWALEISLDVDAVSAACPNCHIILMEADDPSFGNLGTAVDTAAGLGANVISNSYGGPVAGGAGFAGHYSHPGHVITASAGDNGYAAAVPAGFASVVAVGGTTLTKGGTGRGWSETVWSGTGSGCATGIAKPSWQHDTGCSSRTMNDVAADADPNTGANIYISYGHPPGFYGVGGTSLSAPLIAGMYALAGSSGSVNAAQSLYGAAAGTLNDVTKGSNGSCSPAYLCTGEVGYDGPTGNGTPNGVGALSGGGGGGSATLTETILPAGGKATLPTFSGWSGYIGYPKNNAPPGSKVTLTTSTTNIYGAPVPTTGTVQLFEQVYVTSKSPGITFVKGQAKASIASSQLVNGATYSIYAYVMGQPVPGTPYGAGMPQNGVLTFASLVNNITLGTNVSITVEIVKN